MDKKILALVVTLFVLPCVSAVAAPTLFWSYDTGGTVTGVAVSDGGNYTAVASSDGYLYLLNKSKKLMWREKTENTPLKVGISSKGDRIFVGDGSNVYLYNKTGDLQWEFFVGDDIEDLAVTPTGDRVVVGSLNHNIYLLNVVGGVLWKYKANSPVLSVDISSDGKYIAAGTSGSITYMITRDGNLLWEYINTRSIYGVGVLGRQIISGQRYPVFLEDGHQAGSYTSVVCDIMSIDTTGDDEFALVGCDDGNIYLIDSQKHKRWSYEAGESSRDASISPRGDFIAVASGSTVYILESPDIAPPVVEITSPKDGGSVSGLIDIDAKVTEDSSYTLKVTIDGDYACSKLPCTWNTGAASDGEHTIKVEVNDSGGNVEADSINVILSNTLMGGISSEISETKEIVEEGRVTLKETEEALRERLDENLPANLPPIRQDRDYGPIIKG
ncbi:PQQ-binding-like beta-propeller repeat protein, partial [archaeon]|nr:PQQ-binding-like beta-propeller repeat protein [archaeon]